MKTGSAAGKVATLISRRASLLALSFGLVGWSFAAESTKDSAAAPSPRIFVCGHSFHIFTAKLLPEMAQGAGIKYAAAGQQMIGGSRTLQHWNLPDDKNKAKAALREGAVDVLTVSPHMLLPDEGIDNFTKLGLEKNPKLRVLVQASWPARDGVESKDFTNEKRAGATLEDLKKMNATHRAWFDKLEAQVRELNKSVGHDAAYIVPVSDAVIALREKVVEGKAPGIKNQSELFRDPLGHPQPALAVLVVYCQFAAIYQRSPEGLPVPSALKGVPEAEKLNPLLQKLAWEAVSSYPMSGVVKKTARAGE